MGVSHDPTKMAVQGLEGRAALVTGGGGGIGVKVVQALQAQGARVAAADLEAPDLDAVLGVSMDVTNEASVAEGLGHAVDELGPIEVLATCAGIYEERPFESLDHQTWRRAIDINLTGTFLSIRNVIPGMRERRAGRVITISSGAGIDGGSEACAHYAASKGGVIALTKAVAKEYAADGITANVIAPRAIRTPMIAGMEDQLAPVGRIGEPEDVAAAVLFLSSEHASYITGEVLVVNGGWW